MSKRLLFPFLSIDYRSAEAWLNERAAEGLRLVGMGALFPVSHCEAAETRKRYAVALWRTDDECQSYPNLAMDFEAFREFAAGAGWEYVDDWGNMRIFEGEADADLTPFHTDPETELHVFRKLFRRRAWIDGIWAAAGILILLLAAFGRGLFPWLSYNFFVACLFALLVLGLVGCWLLTALALQLQRDRQAAREGRALPVLPPEKARRRGMAYWTVNLAAFLLMCACWAVDVAGSVWDYQIHGILLWNLLIVLFVNRRVYRRLPWLRYAFTTLGVILLLVVFAGMGERPDSSRSLFLYHRDHWVEEDMEDNVLRSVRYDSRYPFMVNRAFQVLREEEYLPVEAPGFDRAAGLRTEDGRYYTLVLQREGQALLLDVFGAVGRMELDELLMYAERDLR